MSPNAPEGKPIPEFNPGATSIHIPDHELLRQIGSGSYGEVWLARSALGTFRAVKIVFRKKFTNDRPFEREFNGIQKFEPVSRSHDGVVDILQVGRNDAAGYFYYVMELADDACYRAAGEATILTSNPNVKGQKSRMDRIRVTSVGTYTPRTLAHELTTRERLPIEECLAIGLAITSALAHLHRHGLIHRDIKPSNIIFVNGAPNLVDIGLVADITEARSYVGTEGFIPPEGPGTAQSDIYSLGKVLYEISTGKDRHDYPELPSLLDETFSSRQLLELNEIILKACRTDPRQRYASADQMQKDLLSLRKGRSLRHARKLKQRLYYLAGGTIAATVVGWLCIAATHGFGLKSNQKRNSIVAPSAEIETRESTSLSDALSEPAPPRSSFRSAPEVDPMGFIGWGVAYENIGRFDEAYGAYAKAIELTAPEALIWRFDSEKALGKWVFHHIPNTRVSDGHLVADITEEDPYFYQRGICFSGTIFPRVQLRMRNRTSATRAELFWATIASSEGHGTQRVEFNITPNDPAMSIYTIDLTHQINWKNHIIVMVRVDPVVYETSGGVEIDWISLQPNSNRVSGINQQLDPITRVAVQDKALSHLSSLLKLQNRAPEALPYFVQPRDPLCSSKLIDLTQHYNSGLTEVFGWQVFQGGSGEGWLAGVEFDARGCVQLSGTGIHRYGLTYPDAIKGIRIGRKCDWVHFLVATRWKHAEGQEVGHFVVRYVSSIHDEIVSLVYGEHVRDCNVSSDPVRRIVRAMEVPIGRDGSPQLRAFKITWENPHPEAEIAFVDFYSAKTEAAPFLIAITAD